MRTALAAFASLLVVGCGPTPSQLRLQHVEQARVSAAQRPGPRQAQEFARAVHDANRAGDYRTRAEVLTADTAQAIATIDRALQVAGPDGALLIAWRGLMFVDRDQPHDGLAEFERSFAMTPNLLAGSILIPVYGGANDPAKVGATCTRLLDVLTDADERLDTIATCRENMNAVSPAGEMAWMSPALVAWYQGENARRLGAEIDADNARIARDQREQQVVRQTEQCAATCKESGLRCQNRCYNDSDCEQRCVEINHACLDRCEAEAYEKLGQ
jgi:hypothetical protein